MLGIGNGGFRTKYGRLESVLEEFGKVPKLGIGNGGVRAKFTCLESELEEFEPRFDAWNREWRSSRQVSKLGIGNGGVPSLVPTLGIGNGGVRATFRSLE